MATLTGTEGNDFFDDGTGTPPGGYTHHPGATVGDDFITFLGGDDIADAGPGVDTAFLDEALPYYDIRFRADATIDVTARFGTPDGDKELNGVEKLAFLIGTATVDVSAPRVARLNSGSGADTISISGNVVGGVHQNGVELDRGLFGGDTNLMTFENFGALNLNSGGGNDNVAIGIVYGLGRTTFSDASANTVIAPPLSLDGGAGDDVFDLTSLEFSTFDSASLSFSPPPPNPGLFHLLAGASAVQVRLGAGNDTVLIGPNAGPITVVDNKIGSENPGVNVVESDGLAGNWIGFNSLGIATGTQGVAVDMTTGLATSSIVGHQTTFSGMQNVVGTRGDDTITADQHRANLIDFLNGIDDGVLGGQEEGRHDMVAFSTANGGLAIDLAAGTATGGTSFGLVNATFTGAEGAFGTNFADVCDGSAENDFIFGLGENDAIDCGDGDGDIVGFTGLFSQYSIVQNPDGSFTVADLRTPAELPAGVVSDGVDTCSNVEIFRFTDRLVSADAAGSAEFKVNLADVVTGATPATIVGGAGGDNTVEITLDGDVGAQVVRIEIEPDPDPITPDQQDILLLLAGIGAVAGETYFRVRDGQHIEFFAGDGGDFFGDGIHISVNGNFVGTTLAPRTLTLHGGVGDDNFDASGVTSDHRVVMNAGSGADTLLGGAGADILDGGTGNDGLSGGTNDDSLNGAAGADTLVGGAGSDVLIGGLGADTLSGGEDADYLLIDAADTGIDGGAGFDSVFVQTSAAVTLDMGAVSIEWAQGNAGADTFNAASQTGAVYIYGQGGDDTLTGSAFGDYLDGGDGTDTLVGGDGNDVLFGNGGSDIMLGQGGDDYLIEMGGDSQLDGGGGFDSLFVWSDTGMTLNLMTASIEWVQGSVLGDDTLNGAGNTVNTFLYGWGGNDTLTGGSGNDYIAGGTGNDTLTGGVGHDTMIGEAGVDRYVYTATIWGADTIHSFDPNGEKLDFTAVASIDSFADFTTFEWDPGNLGNTSTTLFYTNGGTTSAITLIGVQVASLSDSDFLFA